MLHVEVYCCYLLTCTTHILGGTLLRAESTMAATLNEPILQIDEDSPWDHNT